MLNHGLHGVNHSVPEPLGRHPLHGTEGFREVAPVAGAALGADLRHAAVGVAQ